MKYILLITVMILIGQSCSQKNIPNKSQAEQTSEHTTLSREDLNHLLGLNRGDSASIYLPGYGQVTGAVNMEYGTEAYQSMGFRLNDQHTTLTIYANEGKIHGNIIDQDNDKLYEFSENQDGQLIVQEKQLSKNIGE